MKANKILSSALLALLLLSSCASDDLTTATAPAGNGKGNIHFTLGGSAKSAASRADDGTTLATEGESRVNSLYAVLFDTHDGFYKTVQATDLGGGEYDILVEKDATYDVYFVANPSDELVSKLENIPAETSYDQALAVFYTIITDQAPDAKDNFLMYGSYKGRVTTTITRTEDLGEVSLSRRSARFDIVNKAEGITVTKITFNKRSVKTPLTWGNYNPKDEEGMLESTPKEYTPEGLVGSKENPTEYRHEIYSYPNLSFNPDSVPSIDIEYVENVDGKDVTKKHIVKFIDPNAPAGTPLAIRLNSLYTITLSKAYKLEFNLSVADWEAEEVFNQKELPIELPEDVQEELNKQLYVYDLFADYNVKTLNLTDKTVEFFDDFKSANDYPAESYFLNSSLHSNGLSKNGTVFTDAEGNKYRLPTAGELMLLAPFSYTETSTETSDENGFWGIPVFASSRTTLPTDLDENIYLKNDENGYILENDEDGNALSSKTQLMRSSITRPYYSIEGYYYCDEDAEGARKGNVCNCYGIRFKGTKEYAAYKWEPLVVADNDLKKRYMSVKIKALPAESEITVYDITDNETFWRDGYIEIKLPITAYLQNTTKASQSSGYLGCSSKYKQGSTDRPYYLGFNNVQARVYHATMAAAYPLRLVKVKETAENPAE